LASLYEDDDLVSTVEESALLQRKYEKIHRRHHRQRRLWYHIQKSNWSIRCFKSRTSMGSCQLDLLNTIMLKQKKTLFWWVIFKISFSHCLRYTDIEHCHQEFQITLRKSDSIFEPTFPRINQNRISFSDD